MLLLIQNVFCLTSVPTSHFLKARWRERRLWKRGLHAEVPSLTCSRITSSAAEPSLQEAAHTSAWPDLRVFRKKESRNPRCGTSGNQTILPARTEKKVEEAMLWEAQQRGGAWCPFPVGEHMWFPEEPRHLTRQPN